MCEPNIFKIDVSKLLQISIIPLDNYFLSVDAIQIFEVNDFFWIRVKRKLSQKQNGENVLKWKQYNLFSLLLRGDV